MKETTGWTIFGCTLAVCILLGILIGVHVDYKGKTALANAGLQECMDIGSRYSMWQKECRK